MRRKAREIHIGDLTIGGNAPILVQSMANTKTEDVAATSMQIKRLQEHGCKMIRLAIPSMEAAEAIPAIKDATGALLCADIHFDYRLALRCIENGIDKIRINPGNIGDADRVKQVANACNARHIPIRIGMNGGSLPRELLAKYGAPCADALVEGALYNIRLLEQFDFHDIVISMKSSSVAMTIDSYVKLADYTDYPFHIGVTEAGTERMGLIKSAIGIGSLLARGIGDTIRVSLTDAPEKEMDAGFDILRALDMLPDTAQLVSCPTCGRTRIDLIGLANEVERRLRHIHKPIKVAVMGCAVNGPGEAREADVGIAGGDGKCILFKKGEIVASFPEGEAVERLFAEIEKL